MSAAAGGGTIARRLLISLIVVALAALPVVFVGCGSSPLLSAVGLSRSDIAPNGAGMNDTVRLSYHLARRSTVTVYLDGKAGRFYLRKDQARTEGDYQILFDGAVQPAGKGPVLQQVIPNGSYDFVVEARDARSGAVETQRAKLSVHDADTEVPRIERLLIDPNPITPNGDATDDETYVSFTLTKKSLISVNAVDASGNTSVIAPEHEEEQGPLSVKWDGRSEGLIVPDGQYTIVITAQDSAGNVSQATGPLQIAQGGAPMGRIIDVHFSPTSLPLGGRLKVEMTVRNVGTAVMKTLGPDPGQVYTTDQSFNSIKLKEGKPVYYERPGVWRVGIDWEGNSFGRPYPIRWGLGHDLKPGEQVTIVGYVDILQTTPTIKFWAGLVQEGVGYPQDKIGTTAITVGY